MEKGLKSKFKNAPLTKKLLLSFGIVVLLTTTIMGFAIYFVARVGSFAHLMYDGPYISTTSTETIRADIHQAGNYIRSGMLEQDLQKYDEQISKVHEKVLTELKVIKEHFGGDIELVNNLEKTYTELNIQRQKVYEIGDSGDLQGAFDVLVSDYMDAFNKTMDATDALYDDADANAVSFDQRATTVTTVAFVFLAIVFVGAVFLAIFLSLYTTKSIVRPMKELEKAANDIANGNLKAIVEYTAGDEIGSLANSIRSMIKVLNSYITDISRGMGEMAKGNLDVVPKVEFYGDFTILRDNILAALTAFNNVMLNIDETSIQVANGSEQVSNTGNVLSQGAGEQSVAVEELSVTISEIADRVRNSAKNALAGSDMANLVGKDIERSNEDMAQMVEAMTEISNTSNEISKIIQTIEDIASQTNLLSLNASIEAARAGEAGKGFAVVADEVGNLASESAEASKNSTTLIKTSLAAVEKGMHIVEKTAESLLKVVDNAKNVVKTVDQISTDSKAQSDSIDLLSYNVNRISQVVEENSAAVEQSAASSQELSQQALLLKQLVEKFHLKR